MNRFFFGLFSVLVLVGCGSIRREYKTPIDLSAAVDRAVAETVVVVEPFEAVAVAGPYRVVVPPIEKGTLPPVGVSEKVVLEDADAHVLTWRGHVDDLHKQRAALVAQHESMGGEPVLSGGNTSDELEQDIANILRDLYAAHEAASAKVYEDLAADYPDSHTVAGGDTFSEILYTHVYNWPERIAEIAAANGIANSDLIFPGQVIRLPPREKPEAVPPVTDEVAEGTTADRTSFGEALVGRYSPRARAERQAQQTSSPDETPSGRFSPPPRPQQAEEVAVSGDQIDVSASAEPVADTDETVVQPAQDTEALKERAREIARRGSENMRKENARAKAEAMERPLPILRNWYGGIDEDWTWWEHLIWKGGVLTLLAICMFFAARWHIDRRNNPRPKKLGHTEWRDKEMESVAAMLRGANLRISELEVALATRDLEAVAKDQQISELKEELGRFEGVVLPGGEGLVNSVHRDVAWEARRKISGDDRQVLPMRAALDPTQRAIPTGVPEPDTKPSKIIKGKPRAS